MTLFYVIQDKHLKSYLMINYKKKILKQLLKVSLILLKMDHYGNTQIRLGQTFMAYNTNQLLSLYSMMPQQALKTLRLSRTRELLDGPPTLQQTCKTVR